MSLTAAALRLMAEKGLSAQDIVEIAEALEADRPVSTGAARQQRWRDRQRERNASDVTRNVTSDVTERDATPFPSPSPSFPPDPQTNPTPAHTPEGDTPRPRKANPFPRPDWCDEQVWADFLENRKRKRLANTASAHKRLMDDLERLSDEDWPPGRLLEHAAATGWAAIYDPRTSQERHGTSHNNRERTGPVNPMARAAAELQAERASGQQDVVPRLARHWAEDGGAATVFP